MKCDDAWLDLSELTNARRIGACPPAAESPTKVRWKLGADAIEGPTFQIPLEPRRRT